MADLQRKALLSPDETRTFPKGKLELVTLHGVTFGKATLQPGWRWSTCVKPLCKTESCRASHLQFGLSGRLHVVMDDGREMEFGPGDVTFVPPGHDDWVVGDETFVAVDITGMRNYAKPEASRRHAGRASAASGRGRASLRIERPAARASAHGGARHGLSRLGHREVPARRMRASASV